MSPLTQNNRLLKIDTILGGDTLLLDEMIGREAVSEPFNLDLMLISEDGNLELKRLMGSAMTIRLLTDQQQERFFHGHVSVFQKLGSDGSLTTYRAILSPFSAFMSRRFNHRLFQEKNLQTIFKEVAAPYGTLARIEFDVKKDESRTLVVQYGESDWSFISRLAEEAGWTYYFVHEEARHTLVFREATPECPELPLGNKLEFNIDSGATKHDTISQWSGSRQLVPNKVAVKTFDFKSPGSPMLVKVDTNHEMGSLPDMESYMHPGAYTYKDDAVGEKYAVRRIEAYEAASKVFMGQSNVRHMLTGHWFELTGHWEHEGSDRNNNKFLLLAIEHSARNNYLTEESGTVYANSFECIRLKVPYRPGLRTQKPVMRGPQTATVVGNSGEEIHCDQYGRVLVQFHWDREGQFDAQSMCWVRVSTQWAGSRFGFVSLPRIGTEVIVDFLEGDPDRPIITGAVYNESNLPPWDLPNNKTQSGILTRSYKGGTYENANALRFEDKKGAEEIWLHAEKDQRIEVENNESHDVGNDRTKTIKHDETVTVGNNRTEHVVGNETITIDMNRTKTVTGNETVSVTGNETVSIAGNKTTSISQFKSETVALASTEQVGLARNLMVGAAYTIEVGAAMNTLVVGIQGTQVMMNRHVSVNHDQTTKVGGNHTEKVDHVRSITAGDRIEITCGKSKLVMEKDGTISLNGKTIDLGSTSDTSIIAKGNLVQKGRKIKEN